MSIAIRRQYLKNAIFEFKQRNIKGPTTKIVDRDHPLGFLLQPIGQGRRRRFVDDSQHFKPSDEPGIFRGL